MRTCDRKKVLSFVMFCAIMFGISPYAGGATTVKRNISKDSKWTAAKSPYVVEKDIVLEQGVTLEIMPGSRIELEAGRKIEVRGKLLAIGTPDEPITFTAHSENPWGTLHFTDFSDDALFSEEGRYLDGCILKHCIIEKGLGIFVRFGAPLITECEVRNNLSSGIRVEFGAPRIVRNSIFGNSTEQDPASGNGGGIIAYTDKNVLIADNVINNNISDGGRDGGGGIYAYASDDAIIIIRNNVLFGNRSSRRGGGIYAYRSLLTRNTIIDNAASERGGGIYAVESKLLENLVQSNIAENGGGIYAENSDIALNSMIRNAALRSEGGALYYFGSGRIDRNCFVSNSANGVRACGGIYVSGNPEIRLNNLLNNTGYALCVANVADAPMVMAAENFWGALSEKAILRLTFDWLDDEVTGLANCMPYLERLSPDAPLPPPFNLMAVATENGVELSWDEPHGTSFEGHRIYYGAESGYPYDEIVKAGPEKSLTITGLRAGVEYSFAVSGFRYMEDTEVETGLSGETIVLFTGSDEAVAEPGNLSPADAQFDVSKSLVLEASRSKPDAGAGAFRWQVSTASDDFTSLAIDELTSGDDRSQLPIAPQTLLDGQKYYWRVAYRTPAGSWSKWSKPASFTTLSAGPSIISGLISSMTKLEKRSSPYQVAGNVLITSDGSLQIEPGVELRFAAGKNLMVNGKLVARGTDSEPILFTKVSPENWGRIIFADSSEDAVLDKDGKLVGGCVLEQCTVEYGRGLLVNTASPLIKGCTISHNDGSGITVRQGGPVIVGNDIHNNLAPTNGGGIYAYTNDIIYITSNRIHDNRAGGEGGGVFAYGYMNTSTIRVEDNDIVSNEAGGDGAGIFLSRSSAVKNRVKANQAGGNGGGIYATFALVDGNELRGNRAAEGGGIFAERNSGITDNYVASNKVVSGFGGGVYINFWGTSIENELFARNTVTANSGPAGKDNGGVFVVGYLIFEENNIYENDGSQLHNGNESESPPLVTRQCYWGAADESEISKGIVDGRVDPKLGEVTFVPFSPELLEFD